MSEYTLAAEKFLSDNQIEFRAVLIGDDCPTFCPDAEKQIDMDKVNVFPRRTHIHGKHYRCTFSKKGKGHFAVDFWNSYADEQHNYELANKDWRTMQQLKGKKRIVPQAYDVLACITKNDSGSFDNFCGDFEYNTDSRKAHLIYESVQREWVNVQRFFTSEEIEIIKEIN